MTCADSDLLLYAHNELPPLRRWVVSRHLARCSRCRMRLTELQAASFAIASAVRDPGMPQWSLAGHPATPPFWKAPTFWAAVVLIALVGGGIASLALSRRSPSPPVVTSTPCRPDLPSDRCR